MEIYQAKRALEYDEYLPLEDLYDLNIRWDSDGKKYYTLIIYDTTKKYLHYLEVDITKGKMGSGKVLVEYQPPNPPREDEDHEYVFSIYMQGTRTDIPSKKFQRSNFDVIRYIRENQLSLYTNTIIYANSEEYYYPELKPGTDFMKNNTYLAPEEEKYCSCIARLSEKQSPKCLESIRSGKKYSDKCYNPYAVCAKSTKSTSRKCHTGYLYNNMSDKQLKSLALLKGKITSSQGYNREKIINILKRE